jgi:hypothetical protein
MKNIHKYALGFLALILLVVSAFAQEYKGRQDQPQDREKIAGLTYYVQDVDPIFLFYSPSNYQQFELALGTTNAVVFGSAAPTNVFCALPNVTNSLKSRFRVVAGDRVTVILTNVAGSQAAKFMDSTNASTSSAAIWTMRTNSAVEIQNVSGTNWFVLPVKS